MAINANRSDIILKYYVAEIVSRPYKESIQFAYVRLWQNVYGKRTPIHIVLYFRLNIAGRTQPFTAFE